MFYLQLTPKSTCLVLGRSSRLTLQPMFFLLVKFHYKVKLKLKNSLSDFGGFQLLEVREKKLKIIIFMYLVSLWMIVTLVFLKKNS
jgi:hypothetical protein